MTEQAQRYDLIGDIHGEATTLCALLDALGYSNQGGCYQHPERQVIFLGDFVDRGAGQREVVEIARAMVEQGAALAIMGNHEFNAIAYYTPLDAQNSEAGYLRVHSESNSRQHQAFLDAYAHDASGYREVINWFKTLPMWLELPGLRAVHACWDPQAIEQLTQTYPEAPLLPDSLLHTASTHGSWEFAAVCLLSPTV